MLYTLLDEFKKTYDLNGDALFVDNHQLKSGIYLKVNMDSGRMEHLLVKKKETLHEGSELFSWFRRRDFYSNLITMNKAIDTKKKIHSNNIYTIFIKKNLLIGKEAIGESEVVTSIARYYQNFRTTYEGKKGDIEVSKNADVLLGGEIEDATIGQIERYLTENISRVIKYLAEYEAEIGDYVKVFIEATNKEYECEGNRYFFRKIFNSNEFNLMMDGSLYGLSGANMGLNSKKPFLEHKTMKAKVPFRVTAENALLIHRYLLWWKAQGFGQKVIPQDFNYTSEADQPVHKGFNKVLLKSGVDTDSIKIEDFDIIPKFEETLKPLELSNALRIKDWVKSKEKAETRFEMLMLINNYWFSNKKLFIEFLTSDEALKFDSRILAEIYASNKRLFFNFLVKGVDVGMESFILKYGRLLVEESLFKNGRRQSICAFHLYEGLLNRFTKEGDTLKQSLKEMMGVMNVVLESNNDGYRGFESIEEYSFFSGQLAYYLLSQSQKEKLSHDAVKPFLSCVSVEKLNKELGFWFEKYSHALYMKGQKFNQLLSWTLSYDTTDKINKNLFLAGYLADNMFYMKGDTSNDN